MTKQKRNKLDRQLIKLALEDNCSICSKPFTHGSTNYGGETYEGEAAIVGACCRSRLKYIVMGSIYLSAAFRSDVPPVVH